MDPAGRATRGDLRELRAEFAGLDDRALVAEVRAAPARGGAGVALFPPLPRDRAVVVLDGLGSGWRAALDGPRDDAQLAVLLENLDPDDRAAGRLTLHRFSDAGSRSGSNRRRAGSPWRTGRGG